MPHIFPKPDLENRVTTTTGVGSRSGFDCLMSDCIPCLDALEKSQCFPLYLYEPNTQQGSTGNLFAEDDSAEYIRKDGITDEALQHFQTHYQDISITKQAMFYYIYEVLHDAEYREKYKDNLSRELAHILCLGDAAQFWRMSEAGRIRGEAHMGYETAEPYPLGGMHNPEMAQNADSYYRIEKMNFAKRSDKSTDRSTLVVNNHITLTNIPESAFAYQVGGRSPIEWAIDRLQRKTDKDKRTP